ncbi:MAG: ribosome maturation factor RimP [Clostridiales bacterium]|jgi:ribosome maturation factor RimP|nr:ribosome maturation factor RimP [Clostridiales bacterium]
MGKTIEEVRTFIEKIVFPMGYEVLATEYSKKYGELNLTVFIDGENAITLEDCERVHNAIDAPLDGLDPTDGAPYVLNVSSYGIDKPFKTERDFKRAAGKELEISLFNAVGGKKKFVGTLAAYDEKTLTIIPTGAASEAEAVSIERKNAARIGYHIRFD